MNRNAIITSVILAVGAAFTAWMLLFSPAEEHTHDHHHGHDEHEADFARGPHGGRLLAHDDFELEITLFETGLPPEFRVYAYDHGKPVAADKLALVIMLERSGGKTDQLKFRPRGEFLRGNKTVYEPHSFRVSVSASYDGNNYSWQYDNFEGRTQIHADIAAEMGIGTEAAGPVTLAETRTLTGRVQTNPTRLSRVRPRFPGVVKRVRHELGDVVKQGAVLATVQSNESLQDYQVTAPIAGLIVKRDIQAGEATGNDPLFIIADLSEVWVELDVFARDLGRVKPGQPVVVETLDGAYSTQASIDWVSPLAAHASQSVHARVVVSNKDAALRPGQFVRGHVTVAEEAVALAVKRSALQYFRDFQVVFARFGDLYEVRMLELGRQNGDWVEVLGGIEAGTEYVSENSYLIKADIEKSGASHDH